VWTPTGPLNMARASHTATLLPNGKVLVAGGECASNLTATAEIYDPATETGTLTNPLAVKRLSHAAIFLLNGKGLVSGGTDETDLPICNSELYDPITGAWALTGALNEGRYDFTATRLSDGKVLVSGGQGLAQVLQDAEVYDGAIRICTATGPLSVG